MNTPNAHFSLLDSNFDHTQGQTLQAQENLEFGDDEDPTNLQFLDPTQGQTQHGQGNVDFGVAMADSGEDQFLDSTQGQTQHGQGNCDPNLEFLVTTEEPYAEETDLNASFNQTSIQSPTSMQTSALEYDEFKSQTSSLSAIYTPFPNICQSQSSSKKSTPALEYVHAHVNSTSLAPANVFKQTFSQSQSSPPSRSTSPVPGSVETHGSKIIRIEDSGRVIATAKKLLAARDEEDDQNGSDENDLDDFPGIGDNEDDNQVDVPIMDDNVRENFKEECDVNVEFGFTGRLYFRIHFFKNHFYRILR